MESQETKQKATSSDGLSEDTRNIIVVLLLLFFWPAGVVLMWAWTQWPQWVKVLISAIAVGLVILSALFMVFWLFFFGTLFSRIMLTADKAIERDYQRQEIMQDGFEERRQRIQRDYQQQTQEMKEQYQQEAFNATPSGYMNR